LWRAVFRDDGFADFLLVDDDLSAAARLPLTLRRSASMRSTMFDGRSSRSGGSIVLPAALSLHELAELQLELVLELRRIEVA
jgi:hypothetical protein